MSVFSICLPLILALLVGVLYPAYIYVGWKLTKAGGSFRSFWRYIEK